MPAANVINVIRIISIDKTSYPYIEFMPISTYSFVWCIFVEAEYHLYLCLPQVHRQIGSVHHEPGVQAEQHQRSVCVWGG